MLTAFPLLHWLSESATILRSYKHPVMSGIINQLISAVVCHGKERGNADHAAVCLKVEETLWRKRYVEHAIDM